MLIGNLLMHAKYKRRQKAVKNLSNVYTRFNQVIKQYQQHCIEEHSRLLQKQLEYLHALNLKQFNANIQLFILAAHKSCFKLLPTTLRQDSKITFYTKGMLYIFLNKGVLTLLYVIIGNRKQFNLIQALLEFLFLQNNNQKCKGQERKLYCLILQKSFKFVKRQLGHRLAKRQLDKFFYLICLTHQILLYPLDRVLIKLIKISVRQGLNR